MILNPDTGILEARKPDQTSDESIKRESDRSFRRPLNDKRHIMPGFYFTERF
jgi:hypothetical protein